MFIYNRLNTTFDSNAKLHNIIIGSCNTNIVMSCDSKKQIERKMIVRFVYTKRLSIRNWCFIFLQTKFSCETPNVDFYCFRCCTLQAIIMLVLLSSIQFKKEKKNKNTANTVIKQQSLPFMCLRLLSLKCIWSMKWWLYAICILSIKCSQTHTHFVHVQQPIICTKRKTNHLKQISRERKKDFMGVIIAKSTVHTTNVVVLLLFFFFLSFKILDNFQLIRKLNGWW